MKTEHLFSWFSVVLFVGVFEGLMNISKFFFRKSLGAILFLHYRQKKVWGLEHFSCQMVSWVVAYFRGIEGLGKLR